MKQQSTQALTTSVGPIVIGEHASNNKSYAIGYPNKMKFFSNLINDIVAFNFIITVKANSKTNSPFVFAKQFFADGSYLLIESKI
jgi:hypothetical protein